MWMVLIGLPVHIPHLNNTPQTPPPFIHRLLFFYIFHRPEECVHVYVRMYCVCVCMYVFSPSFLCVVLFRVSFLASCVSRLGMNHAYSRWSKWLGWVGILEASKPCVSDVIFHAEGPGIVARRKGREGKRREGEKGKGRGGKEGRGIEKI